MGTTSSVLQWYCVHCRAINTTENTRCVSCRQPRTLRPDQERLPPSVPLRKERRPCQDMHGRSRQGFNADTGRRTKVALEERHLYDDAEGCDPPPVPAHKTAPGQQHLYAELEEPQEDEDEHEYDEYAAYAVLEYPAPFPSQRPSTEISEPIYGVVNKVRKKPPPPPPHLCGSSRTRQEPEAVYYSEVEQTTSEAGGFEIDIDNLPPPLPPHKEELSLTTDARKWYCLNCRIWNTAQDSSCVYCAMPYSDDVLATGTGLR